MTPVHITGVTSIPTLRGTLWRVRASDGQRYSTLDPWAASLCQQAMKTGRGVLLHSGAGWFDRAIRHVELAETEATV